MASSEKRCLVKSALLVGTGRQARFLPLLVAILTYLVALLLYVSVSTAQLAGAWNRSMTGTLTIQLDGDTDEADTRSVLSWLQKQPQVKQARQLSDGENAELLRPWLGDVENLPDSSALLPKLVDVKLTKNADVDIEQWQSALQDIAPSAAVDNHQRWLGDTVLVTGALRKLCMGLVLLLLVALAVTIGLATRMLLAVNAPVVDVLHRIGAADSYIRTRFAKASAQLTAVGAGVGLALAGLSLLLILRTLGSTTYKDLFVSLPFTWLHAVSLLLLPVLAVGLSLAASNWVVQRYLFALR